MSQATYSGVHVVICDWHGIVKWISTNEVPLKKGELFWKHVADADLDRTKESFAKVVTLQTATILEIAMRSGKCYRMRLWPLESPEMAVCALRISIPKELQRLSVRERAAVNLLAKGASAKSIAAELDVSISTVHTHFQRARAKLKLQTMDELIAFGSRYCQQGWDINGRPEETLKLVELSKKWPKASQ